MAIGERIKTAREAAGLTQEELGDKIGVTGVTIMRYEKNLREPKHKTLLKLAEALGVWYTDLTSDSLELFLKKDWWKDEQTYSELEKRIIDSIELLTPEGQQKVYDRIGELLEIPRYRVDNDD